MKYPQVNQNIVPIIQITNNDGVQGLGPTARAPDPVDDAPTPFGIFFSCAIISSISDGLKKCGATAGEECVTLITRSAQDRKTNLQATRQV